MKIKRFKIERPSFEVESNHQILARILVLSKMHKLIKICEIHLTLNGQDAFRPFYRLYIPKIRYVKGDDADE